ncbi:MAG: carbamoyltransferase HypF [Hydrogenophaga sp.]|uniref:Kae1-like domain-containing protein n=1 Tax=Hydrogenophaga sp. TaxID=1904254 RepID=UPI001DEB03DC|nr:carbamoyltransferase HypF [Hydrogenophaga sp.]MBX3609054.1 carbamoyltransferase HypF [Hydrogenophaga sp.]
MQPDPSVAVLACGAWLKNAACLWLNGRAHWSPVHGDLGEPGACEALDASLRALIAQAEAAGTPVQRIAHDLHPDFFSTQLARRLADELGVPAIGVQHHHAHLAAVLAEHGLHEPVVGLALDGVGLGTDGQAWGGELLWLHAANWRRLGHLRPLALPGGDRAAREPWRMAASALHALGRGAEIPARFAPLVGEPLARGVQQLLDRGLQSPPSTGAGRWFDAAAAALGLCVRQQDEAQAPMALEQAAARALAAGVPVTHQVRDVGPEQVLDWQPLLSPLFDVLPRDVDRAALGFHLALADALVAWAVTAARVQRVRHVALGGGCFFNRILSERVTQGLRDAGLHVLTTGGHGCGDAGLALGQAWVAAHTPPSALPALPAQTAPAASNVDKEIAPCV